MRKLDKTEKELIVNLFDSRYSSQEKKDLLAKFEKENILLQVIKKYYPQYVTKNLFGGEELMHFVLIKDLGWMKDLFDGGKK